jgi:hypothetical protein
MKISLKHIALPYCFFSLIFRLHSQGYIIANGVTDVGYIGSPGYFITVIQNPTSGDYTGFLLKPQDAITFLFSPLLDEGVRTFLVSANNPISLQPILSNNYTELLNPNTYLFEDGVPFYLGFYTGYNPWDSHGAYTGIYSNPVFGWGEFVNNGGAIQMLDSALEIEGGGIYAGTQTIIPAPEPSTFALTALGGLLLGFRRWRK